jgi:hypothetical protein
MSRIFLIIYMTLPTNNLGTAIGPFDSVDMCQKFAHQLNQSPAIFSYARCVWFPEDHLVK